MAQTTGIEWCDATFNPWWGCERVSPACAHCYADALATRYGHAGTWGAGHGFRFFGDKHWNEPLRWARTLPAKLGRRPRVFCASMADVFEEREELIPHRRRLIETIIATPELDWLILTKRPEFARRYFGTFYIGTPPLPPLPNIWLGVSIENSRYTWRADVLRRIPAAVRFISAEPLLGSLFASDVPQPPAAGLPYTTEILDDLAVIYAVGRVADVPFDPTPFNYTLDQVVAHLREHGLRLERRIARGARGRAPLDLSGIDWVIAGGESGPRARPSHPDWFRELRDACLDGIVPGDSCDHCRLDRGSSLDRPEHWAPCERPAFFFKQWGEWAPLFDTDDAEAMAVAVAAHVSSQSGTRRVVVGDTLLERSGKKRNGRALDGRTWDEFPASAAA